MSTVTVNAHCKNCCWYLPSWSTGYCTHDDCTDGTRENKVVPVNLDDYCEKWQPFSINPDQDEEDNK